MNKLSLWVCLAFAFFVSSAVAQMAPQEPQGGTQSSPSASQPGQYPSQGAGQTSADQNATTKSEANAEHTLKGCVQSEGGSYVLETRKGKQIALTGQDVSSHVGHAVALKGNWEGGKAVSSAEAGSPAGAGAAAKTFEVSSVKMISETCKAKDSTGSMSSPSASPSGTGTTTQQPPK